VAHPLPEVLFLVVCGTICDCDDYDLIADWGAAHLDFLRCYLPYDHGVPGGRWLTILMNRIDPNLFSAAFTVRQAWPDRPDFIAIDGNPVNPGCSEPEHWRSGDDNVRPEMFLHLLVGSVGLIGIGFPYLTPLLSHLLPNEARIPVQPAFTDA
jgi:hypothetical protein